MKKIVIFDLDGTLHYTEKALVPAIQMAMIDLGYKPASPDDINSLYGEPLEVFCRQLLKCDDKTCSEFRRGIRVHQRITLREKGELYPGTFDMLSELKDMGINLAVCSNAGVDYIELVTSALGIKHLFSLFEGRDGQASKAGRLKKIISRTGSSFAVMVGDRYHDIEAASENGILSIGCLYGYGTAEEMSKADYTVKKTGEIVPIIETLLAEDH